MMFRKSLLICTLVIGAVFASSFLGQMMVAGQLPSAHDPGIRVEEAFQTSKKPLLIEFYTDSCSACKAVTPMVHRVHQNQFADQLMLVMVDVENPANQGVSQLFGITSVPAVFVFDHRHMKKEELPYAELHSPLTIEQAVKSALSRIEKRLNAPR